MGHSTLICSSHTETNSLRIKPFIIHWWIQSQHLIIPLYDWSYQIHFYHKNLRKHLDQMIRYIVFNYKSSTVLECDVRHASCELFLRNRQKITSAFKPIVANHNLAVIWPVLALAPVVYLPRTGG